MPEAVREHPEHPEHPVVPAEARLGNDIARQFAHLPPSEAAQAVARHVEMFWDPRMRQALAALAAAHDDTLDPLLAEAAGRLPARASGAGPEPSSSL